MSDLKWKYPHHTCTWKQFAWFIPYIPWAVRFHTTSEFGKELDGADDRRSLVHSNHQRQARSRDCAQRSLVIEEGYLQPTNVPRERERGGWRSNRRRRRCARRRDGRWTRRRSLTRRRRWRAPGRASCTLRSAEASRGKGAAPCSPAAAGARDCRCDSSCMTAESGDGCHLRAFDPPPGRVACVRAARRIVLLLP